MSNPFDAIHEAAWAAINNYPELVDENKKSLFQAQFNFCPSDGEELTHGLWQDEPPAGCDLPAIAIYPAPSNGKDLTSCAKGIEYQLQVTIWTQDWNLREAHDLVWRAIYGLFQGKRDGETVPSLRQASSNQAPVLTYPLRFERRRLGTGTDKKGTQVTRSTFIVVCKIHFGLIAQ